MNTAARPRDEAAAPKPRAARSRTMPRRTSTGAAPRLPWSSYSTPVTPRGPLLLPIPFLLLLFGDPLDTRELGAFVEVEEPHALRRAPHLADLLDARAYEDAAGGDEHDLVLVADQHRADDLAVALGGLDRDHPLRASPVAHVFGDRRALAEAVLGRGQHRLGLAVRDQHRDHALAFGDPHAAHPARLASRRPHVGFLEAHRLAGVGKQHHVVLALGDRSP